MKNEAIVWCIQNCDAYVMGEYAQEELNNITSRIAELETQVASLTAANESMQEDAVQNTYAFNLMLEANRSQTTEIEELKLKNKRLGEALKALHAMSAA
jgi:hypothetical protein